MENLIIPITFGRGKTGQAKTGKQRPLIVSDHPKYPNAFNDFTRVSNFLKSEYKKSYPNNEVPPVKSQLLSGISIGSHVYEVNVLDVFNLVFVNLDMFKGREYNYLKSFKIPDLDIEVNLY